MNFQKLPTDYGTFGELANGYFHKDDMNTQTTTNNPESSLTPFRTCKPTSSPWHIGVRQPSSDKFIYGPKGEEIADCDRLTNFPEENLANAKLIAAAPELLEACKEALYGVDDDKAIEMIRKAISKAEGTL